MSFYPVVPSAVSSIADAAGRVVAVRLSDLASPSGWALGEGDRSALVIAGTSRVRSGDEVVFLKVIAVAPARVRRDGRVQADGSPCDHATLGAVEERLDRAAGPGVIDGIAGRVVLRGPVAGERRRLLSAAFVLRAVVLMTLMPQADAREVLLALAGDLALVPWARPWRPASPQAFRDWRSALGPEPLEELRDVVLDAGLLEHRERDWRAVAIGGLRAGAIDGTLIRVPDTPGNRAAFGSLGTSDDSAPFPQVRALLLSDASTRATLGVVHGPSGGDKAAGEQALLDRAMDELPRLFTPDRCWILDRNFPGAARIARIIRRTHVLIRVKASIRLDRTSAFLPDGSYLANLHGDGTIVAVRVIEYDVRMEGQEVPEMFCLVTDLLDWEEYPAGGLARAYKWRWDGSETALREAKSAITGAGPSAGPMLRSGAPAMARQEIAAWTAATEMVRGLARDAALTAAPARKGRQAGLPVHPREISFTAARRAATRAGTCGYETVVATLGKARTTIDRDRHRPRKAKNGLTFPRAGRALATTKATPQIILCNTPA